MSRRALLQVRVGEEGGVVPLVVERAQGTLGPISVEWRTIDRTAVSEGKTPPYYVVCTSLFSISPLTVWCVRHYLPLTMWCVHRCLVYPPWLCGVYVTVYYLPLTMWCVHQFSISP